MNFRIVTKPIRRSRLRLFLGRKYYTLLRYIKWYTSAHIRYANSLELIEFPYTVFRHSTTLIRKLQGVDIKLQYNKIINLTIAARKINGLVIKPGETFSYWRLIGKPTYGKGYLDGLVLNPDGSFKAGVGGGLCQLSNLIYWITLHTPLAVTERYRHSHDVFPDSNRTQPFGSGATCVYNYMDLQICNGTDTEYQLIVYLTDDHLTGEWRSLEPLSERYEVYEKDHHITSTFWGEYMRNNSIYRRVFDLNGELVKDELITENHAVMMYQPLLEGCKPGN